MIAQRGSVDAKKMDCEESGFEMQKPHANGAEFSQTTPRRRTTLRDPSRFEREFWASSAQLDEDVEQIDDEEEEEDVEEDSSVDDFWMGCVVSVVMAVFYCVMVVFSQGATHSSTVF